MVKNKEIVRRVTQMVIIRRLTGADAAELLNCSVRTVRNYSRRYKLQGASGLIDRRHSNFCKLNRDIERQIIECKLFKRTRSACWIRNRLKLNVSTETVRRVLKKHNLNARNMVI